MAEKEYVLGNKAKDLYQFTRQATKPGPDDKVDAKDVAKVMRTIAKAKTIEEMRDTLNATADRLDNRRKRPFFPKSETFGMIKDRPLWTRWYNTRWLTTSCTTQSRTALFRTVSRPRSSSRTKGH